MTMPTKLGRVVLYNEDLPSIKSQNFLIPWYCKVTLQIEYVIFFHHKTSGIRTSTYKVRQPFKHVVFCDYVTNR